MSWILSAVYKWGQQNLYLKLMADFYIQTDKEFYFAGETVNGYIYINVHTPFPQATGVYMKFTGYECVKWLQAQELHRPRHDPHRPKHLPPPYDPIAAIPPHELFESKSNNIDISSCESEDDRSYDHRPKYIKTPNNRYFRMAYYETRNMFTKNQAPIYQCQGLVPGQYSFPFCFKTFEGWPASFEHKTPQKKGVIVYHMTVGISPASKQFQVKYGREITLRETRWLSSQTKESNAEITSCCCIGKGTCSAKMHFEKDGYMPGELVQTVLELDNSKCEADIPSISTSIDFTVTMKSQGAQTQDHGNIFRKNMKGLKAGEAKQAQHAIRDGFNLHSNREIKPTCSGKLLSNKYHLSITCNHDISCACCSDKVRGSIPIIIFPVVKVYAMPSVFQTGWSPQVMEQYNMSLQNDFQNPHLAQMQQQEAQYAQQQAQYAQQQAQYAQQQAQYAQQQGQQDQTTMQQMQEE